MIEIRALAAYFAGLVAAENATNLINRQFGDISLCSDRIRCHELVNAQAPKLPLEYCGERMM
jgi:hypothetical protein